MAEKKTIVSLIGFEPDWDCADDVAFGPDDKLLAWGSVKAPLAKKAADRLDMECETFGSTSVPGRKNMVVTEEYFVGVNDDKTYESLTTLAAKHYGTCISLAGDAQVHDSPSASEVAALLFDRAIPQLEAALAACALQAAEDEFDQESLKRIGGLVDVHGRLAALARDLRALGKSEVPKR